MLQRLSALALVLALAVAGCGDDSVADPDEVLVVATTTILGDLASAVVGDQGTVEVLMPIGVDAHDFTPSSRQAARIQQADLVLAVGLGLEEGLTSVLEGAEEGGATVLWLAPLLAPRPFDFEVPHEDDDHDEDHDDHEDGTHDHGDLDPHIWMDPVRMADAARIVADALDSIRPGIGWSTGAEAYADEPFEGIIERILPAPSVTADDSTFDVRIRLLGQELARLLSLRVEVRFATELKKNVVKVRNDALVRDGNETFVYIPAAAGPEASDARQRVRVQIGQTDGARTEIVSGLRSATRALSSALGLMPSRRSAVQSSVSSNGLPLPGHSYFPPMCFLPMSRPGIWTRRRVRRFSTCSGNSTGKRA